MIRTHKLYVKKPFKLPVRTLPGEFIFFLVFPETDEGSVYISVLDFIVCKWLNDDPNGPKDTLTSVFLTI